MRHIQANLGSPPDFLLVGDGDLRYDRQEWIQAADRWTIITYSHSNVVHLNVHSYPVTPRSMIIVSPGTRAGHSKIDDGTWHKFATFTLPSPDRDRVALPIISELSDQDDARWQRASDYVGQSNRKAISFVWNLLWSLSEDNSVIRRNSVLYEAEDLIRRGIDRQFKVADLCRTLDVPERTLLRIFQIEHGMSVQQFVREVKLREAIRLLVDSDLPIKAVASRVGITDLQHFNKLIRSKVGVAPTTLRMGQRNLR